LPLHDDIAAGLHSNFTRTLDSDIFPLNRNRAVFLHGNAGLPGLDDDLVTGVDDEIFADLEAVVLAYRGAAILTDLKRIILAYRGSAVVADALLMVVAKCSR